jgi:hypothetical protein
MYLTPLRVGSAGGSENRGSPRRPSSNRCFYGRADDQAFASVWHYRKFAVSQTWTNIILPPALPQRSLHNTDAFARQPIPEPLLCRSRNRSASAQVSPHRIDDEILCTHTTLRVHHALRLRRAFCTSLGLGWYILVPMSWPPRRESSWARCRFTTISGVARNITLVLTENLGHHRTHVRQR